MKKSKILIVDDEPYNIDYLEQELENEDFELITANNGKEALEKAITSLPDLVLLDIMMPIMDGFEVLTQLKANSITNDIPVIIISADNNLNSVVRGILLGAEDYLPKPFEPVILHARISSVLEKKHLRDLQKLYLKSLERELDIGREIQKGFLPAELPKVEGWEIAAYFKAAREVAGDFYDAFQLPDGNILFLVGDVCGKGVGAALFMTLFRSLIRVTATTGFLLCENDQKNLNASDLLHQIISFTNNYVADTHADADMFATVFIGLIDVSNGQLTYINCGNEPPILIRDGNASLDLPSTGPVIGVIPGATYVVKEIVLQQNDRLIAFTDGIPDAFNEDGVSFRDSQLKQFINNGNQSPEEFVKIIELAVTNFMGKTDQFDDITLLVIKKCN
jgi:serine phosphatase RsbU (regulator of sigma subunit)